MIKLTSRCILHTESLGHQDYMASHIYNTCPNQTTKIKYLFNKKCLFSFVPQKQGLETFQHIKEKRPGAGCYKEKKSQARLL